MTANEECPCGIAKVDCEYHRPVARVSKSVVHEVDPWFLVIRPHHVGEVCRCGGEWVEGKCSNATPVPEEDL